MSNAERLSRILLIALNLSMALLLAVSASAQSDCVWKRHKEGKWSKCQWVTTNGLIVNPADSTIIGDTTHTRWGSLRVVTKRCVREDGSIRKVANPPVAIEFRLCDPKSTK